MGIELDLLSMETSTVETRQRRNHPAICNAGITKNAGWYAPARAAYDGLTTVAAQWIDSRDASRQVLQRRIAAHAVK